MEHGIGENLTSNRRSISRSALLRLEIRVSISFLFDFVHCSPKSLSSNGVFYHSLLAVTLLDYGAGNVRSLRNAIRYLGFDVKDVSSCPIGFISLDLSACFQSI